MNAELQQLEHRGVRFGIDGHGEILAGPRHALTEAVRATIRRHKAALIAELRARQEREREAQGLLRATYRTLEVLWHHHGSPQRNDLLAAHPHLAAAIEGSEAPLERGWRALVFTGDRRELILALEVYRAAEAALIETGGAA